MSQSEPGERIRPEPKSQKDLSEKEIHGQKASVFSDMLDWLGRLILDQAPGEKASSDQLHAFTQAHDISLKKVQLDEIEEEAKRAIFNLEETKKHLRKKYGQSASCFIAKCLDPKIAHINELLKRLALTATQEGDSFQNFLHHAVEYVQYYQELDEQKLKRRIIQDAEAHILQAIDKDLEVLANYKMHVLDSLVCTNAERLEKEELINRFILPILMEIGEITNYRFEMDSLDAFFALKTMIDDRRNSLVELGLLTIDALTYEFKPQAIDRTSQEQGVLQEIGQEFGHEMGEEFWQEIWQEGQNEPLQEAQPNEEIAITLSFLQLLENRMQDFFVLLEKESLDRDSVNLIEKLLNDLKSDSMRFLSYKIDHQEVRELFKNFQEGLFKAETLLLKHKEKS